LFQEKIQKSLLNRLKILMMNKRDTRNAAYFYNGDIDDIWVEIEEYSDRIRQYSEHFNMLLQRETNNCRDITVTSQVEQYLIQLIALIEEVILANDTTQSQLEEWQMQLLSLENQEINN